MEKVRPPEGAIARVGAALPSAGTLDAAHAMFATGLDALRRSALAGGDSVFPSLFDQLGVLAVYRPPQAAYREGGPQRSRWASLPLSEAWGDGKAPILHLPIKAKPALVRAIGVPIKRDLHRKHGRRIRHRHPCALDGPRPHSVVVPRRDRECHLEAECLAVAEVATRPVQILQRRGRPHADD